jgi:hypothetical protein
VTVADQIKTRIALEGGEEVKATLTDIGKAGQKAFEQVREAAQKTDVGKVQEATAAVAQGFRNVGVAALGTVKALSVIGAGVGVVGTALFGLANHASKLTSDLRDAAIQSGTTAKSFAELAFAADQSGSSAEALTRAFAVLNSGAEGVENKLAAFQVRLKNANGTTRDAGDVFREFAAKVGEIEDPAERAGAVIDVFGRRAGPKLVQLLSEGEKGIAKLSAEANRLGLTFTAAELKIGDDFGDALSKLGKTFAALQARIGLAFGPAFIKLFDNVTEAIVKLTPTILAVVDVLAKQFEGTIDGITQAFGPLGVAIGAAAAGLGSLGVALGVVMKLLGPLAGLVTAAFSPFRLLLTGVVAASGLLIQSLTTLVSVLRLVGVAATAAFGPWGILIAVVAAALAALAVVLLKNFDWEAFKAAALGAWDAVRNGIVNAGTAVTTTWNTVKQFFADLWTGIQNGAQAAWDFIVAGAEGVGAAVSAAFAAVVDGVTSGWEAIKQGAADAWGFVVNTATEALQGLLSFLQPVIERLTQAWEIAKKFAAALSAGEGDSGGGQGFAGGGYVRGPGTTTSDSIWAKLSDQEFVMRAKAVKHYGVGFMRMLNSMRVPADAFRGFANGGLVERLSPLMPPIPRFNEGGLVAAPASGGRPVNLNIGGERFALTADDDTAARLERFAINKATRSAGRKPGWYGGGK